MKSRSKKIWIVESLCLTVLLVGCGKSGVPRLDLTGSVTYDGQAVPAGEVRFEPNVSKGGKGPVGFVAIVDGKYDTSVEDKGPVAGPVRITVSGFTSAKAFAPAIFPQYTYEADLEPGASQMDIEVPVRSKKK